MTKLLKIFNSILLFGAIVPAAGAITLSLNSVSEGGSGNFSAEVLETSCAQTAVVMFHGRGGSPTGPVVQEMRTSLHRAGCTPSNTWASGGGGGTISVLYGFFMFLLLSITKLNRYLRNQDQR